MALGYGHASRLTRYVIRTPNWYNSVAFAVLAGGLAGLGGLGDGLGAAWEGVLYIGFPAVIAAFLTPPVDRVLGGRMTWNRSAFLALLCEGITLVMVPTAAFLHKYLGVGSSSFVIDALVASFALVFGVRLIALIAVSRDSVPRALPPAAIQTVAGAAILFTYTGLFDPISANYFQNLLITSAVYGVGAVAFVRLVDRPMKDGMGVSGVELLRGFIAYISEGTRELEEVFEEMGEQVIVPVTVLSFRRDDGEKARFVLPMAHPGIIGDIGGGNLPSALDESAPSMCFVPHATADHDFNPVSQQEVEKLRLAAEEAMNGITYSPQATPSRRIEVGEIKTLGQRFGDDVLLVSTCSPYSCDDVRFGVGMNAMAEARVAGARETMLVDAHNCCSPSSGALIDPGSARSYDLVESTGMLTEQLFDEPTGDVRLGVASSETRWGREEGIGPLGVRAAVIEAGDQRTAYVVIDGNNMVPALRERLVEELLERVDEAEVMTTDTHVVNRVDSHNMVGEKIDKDDLSSLINRLVEEAINDLEEVEAGMNSSKARITVFGNDRIERLATTTNAVASVGGALAVMTTFVALMLSVLVFLFN